MNLSDKKEKLHYEIRELIKEAKVPIFIVKDIFGGILKDLDFSTGFADVELTDDYSMTRKDFDV